MPFDESKHPRDTKGRFTTGFGTHGSAEKDGKTFSTFGRDAKQKPSGKKTERYIPAPYRPGYIEGAKKGEPMTHKQADSGKVNPNYGNDIAYSMNCQIAVATYLARRNGYDVEALPYDENSMKAYAENPLLFYKEGKETLALEPKEKGQIDIDFLKQKCYNNSIVALEFRWKNINDRHIIIAENTGDGIRLYDPQNNREIKGDSRIKAYLNRTNNLRIADLTNAKVNEKIANKAMRRRNHDEKA